MSDETTAHALLPGEGDINIETRQRVRHECEECGNPAFYRYTFLLANYRSNPASSAYRRDDCSYCSDDSAFYCREHGERWRAAPDGYEGCARFEASPRFAHMFLYWKTIKTEKVTP